MKRLRGSETALLVAILLLGAGFRLVGLGWGEGQPIHPDEEFLRQVAAAVELPDRIGLYFDTEHSPLNPYNRGYGFFVYGTLPLFLTRAVGEGLDRGCADPASTSLAVRLLAPVLIGRAGSECWPGSFSGAGARMIGRTLAALFDLGSLMFVFLAGRRAYSAGVGLLAALLYSLAVLPIQQAHFFTVDAFANLFVAVVLYLALRAAQTGEWLAFAAAGLASGLGMACKISVWPLVALVALAGGLWAGGQGAVGPEQPGQTLWFSAARLRAFLVPAVLRLLVTGAMAFLAFRVAQPYAFVGPGFLGLRLNGQWLRNMAEVQALMSGAVDTYPGHQWTSRTPLVFPGVNMVFWGLGLPLGLAAWVGWGVAGVDLFRCWRRGEGLGKSLLLWVWATGYFLYQGTQWVKSMRYLLPVYPAFVLLAAWVAVRWACLRRFAVGPVREGRRASVRVAPAALMIAGTLAWALTFTSVYVRSHTRIAASRWIFENIPTGSVLATEHWDWAPPLRVDGHDPFGGMYRGLASSSDGTLQLYHDDTLEKRESLLNWLDEANYIIIGSNRLYASISRLPTRYPLTMAYYRALFSGELGFALVADFTSYPALGPFQFPDTEEPFAVPWAPYQYRSGSISVPMPPAEEAFSVYDHPRVLVFQKTPAYSRARAEALLPASLLENVVWVTPRQATRGASRAVFDAKTWAEQQAGGTWSAMFDRNSPQNRSLWVAALEWCLTVTALGWLAFPILFTALPGLADRGYGLARALGLLVVAYLAWLAASLHLLPYTRLTILLAILLVAATGAGVGWRRRRDLAGFLAQRKGLILVHEGLFLALFAAWAWVRALNPDLWHPVVGGEKPMDFAYLNAVTRSTWFPPYDPWFAGGYINYYYFGFVLVGSLARLLGIMPSIAYNLALALFYAFTGGVSFCLAYNLVGERPSSGRSYAAGLLAVLFVLILGNLGEVRLLFNGFRLVADAPTFRSTIPGLAELVRALRGLGMVLRGMPLPFRPETPYWDPTRMIPADASGVGPITEFPAFTFLYADLHAHMLALPYTLCALALALAWARGAQPVLSLLVGGLVMGSLRAVNTWDYPTYLLVGELGLVLGRGVGHHRWWGVLWRGGLLVGLAAWLYQPYIRHYVTAYGRLQAWQGPRTTLDIYLLLIGQFLLPLLVFAALEGRQALREMWRAEYSLLRLPLVVTSAGVALLSVGLALLGVPVAAVVFPALTLVGGLILRSESRLEQRFVWLLTALAVGLTLVVEVVVLRGDIGRMNTVFKFYFQVWTLLAISAAVTLVWLEERSHHWPVDLQQLWWATVGVVVCAMALFPVMSIPAKVRDRLTDATGPTLDGMAYMQYSRIGDALGEVDLGSDYYAIVWLQDNLQGSPVVLEGLGLREYLWGNRVSVYTGLPTVVGWRWHQVQQRMAAGGVEVEQRHLDVNECYGTTDIAVAERILRQYGVRYVYVGPYEHLYYDPQGLQKFDTMVALGMLRVVYNQGGVKIYQVIRYVEGEMPSEPMPPLEQGEPGPVP